MPFTKIKNIGEVEYKLADLPEGIKGKAVIGVLEAPILISENLGPGAKLDYVVAHEVGHRLTLDMILNAYEEVPLLFKEAPNPVAGLIRYFIMNGLKENQLRPLHPKTRENLHKIFEDNLAGRYTDEDTGKEFIAEVYANWATGNENIPEKIAQRFRVLTGSKNKMLTLRSQEAAYDDGANSGVSSLLVLTLIGSIVATIFLNKDNPGTS